MKKENTHMKAMKSILALAGAITSALALQADSTWTNACGVVDWNDEANWNNGVPTGNVKAFLSSSSSKFFYRMTPPLAFTGEIVTTCPSGNSCGLPNYVALTVLDGAAWTVTGNGVVIATEGIGARLSSGFTGTVEIPSGMTFAVPPSLDAGVTFIGAGTLRLDSVSRLARTAGFAGRIEVPSGETFSPADPTFGRAATIALGDGATLAYSKNALARGAIRPIPSWTEAPDAWTYNANNAKIAERQQEAGDEFTIDTRAPFVEDDGTLVLVNDCSQTHSVIYTNRLFRLDEDWGVSFTALTAIPADSKYNGICGQALDGFFHFVLQTDGPRAIASDYGAVFAYATTLGFKTYLYDDGAAFSWWAFGEWSQNYGFRRQYLDGIVYNRPIDYSVTCIGGVMTITMCQDGKSISTSKDVSSKLGEFPKGAYLSFSGSTGWWGITDIPWNRTTVWDFRGWYRERNGGAWQPVAENERITTFNEENWFINSYDKGTKIHTRGNAALNDDGSLPVMGPGANVCVSSACYTPLSINKRYNIVYDAEWKSQTGAYPDGMSFGFVKYTPTAEGDRLYGTGDFRFYEWSHFLCMWWYTYDAGKLQPQLDFYDTNDSNTHVTDYDATDYSGAYRCADNNRLAIFWQYDPEGDLEWRFCHWPTANANSGAVRKTIAYKFNSTKMEKYRKMRDGSPSADNCYLHFRGDVASWGHLDYRLHGITVNELVDNNAVELGTVEVEPGASATVAPEAEFSDSATPVAVFDAFRLGAKSTLALAPAASGVSAAGEISAAGEGAVSVAAGATLEANRFGILSADAKVTLSGNVRLGNAVTFVVPNAVRHAMVDRLVLDWSAAALVDPLPSTIAILDENGRDLSSMLRASVDEDGVRLSKVGLILILR